jgi:hypothetical protein
MGAKLVGINNEIKKLLENTLQIKCKYYNINMGGKYEI